MQKVTVVIPAKNEAQSIGELVGQIRAGRWVDEIIVVDDGSTDGTGEIAEAKGARVLSHPYSKGNGAAIKTGARHAIGDVLVFMDADGQHKPSEIPRLLSRLSDGYDMVVGSRTSSGQANFGRGVANRFYNWLASYMSGQKVKDLTSGFRVAKRSLFLQFLNLLPNGFSYPTTSTMAFFRAGYSVGYEPIDVGRREGKSHIQPAKDGIRFLLIIFKIGTLYSPLKLFMPASLAVLLLGAGYYGYTFFSMGRFTNMSALMFTTSLLVFLVGLVSEQITTLMYKDTDQRDSGNLDRDDVD
ncbi:glycosyltransferase family 2 protein [Marinobacter qingdaonensis]|uniref:Glycosyltransferase family 2 protein n=1 Tax=Marinobacter qingdaonensis TaxID=3108486 RepID=A0ABU5P030_9GAMM|nr:glycosyltransferase family 2 protein [Marinobacter sp. ASW11-75]MEA1081414.1 glycosyltransferase family 2 protein [Marinobacter sp. ASW11-75]